MRFATADLLDAHPELQVLEPGFPNFGGETTYAGPIAIVRAPADNSFVRSALEGPGDGRVLVVDGEGAMTCALLGGNLAKLATQNHWSGLLVNGCVRDAAELAREPIGIRAIAAFPRRSEKQMRGGPVESVTFGGVEFRNGAWLYADLDGVVVAEKPVH